MKNLATLLFAILVSANAHAVSSCKDAMDKAISKRIPSFRYQTLNVAPIGSEQMVEVTAMVYGWTPNSDTLSSYYFLVSATCKSTTSNPYTSHLEDLVLVSEMPGEGGVMVKTVTKQRY